MNLTERLSEAAEGVARNGQASEKKQIREHSKMTSHEPRGSTEGSSTFVTEIIKVQVICKVILDKLAELLAHQLGDQEIRVQTPPGKLARINLLS